MELKLALPEDKAIWALRRLFNRGSIHPLKGAPDQEINLILTRASSTATVETENLPSWAKSQIVSSYRRGEILELTGALDPKPEVKKEPIQTTKKKITKKNNKNKSK